MTTGEFLAAYPQFQSGVSLVPQALAYATMRVAPEAFGDATEMAIGLLAADWLVCSPYGQSMRSDDDKDKPSRYWRQFEQLRKERVIRAFVT